MVKTNLKMGNTFKLDNDTIKSYLQYSDNPAQLQQLLKEITVIMYVSDYNKYFNDDTEKRIVLQVTVKRNNREIKFDYGMSINDSDIIDNNRFNNNHKFDTLRERYFYRKKELQKIEKSLLYDILTCMKAEGNTPLSFNEFCNEYGYNNDSIKAKETWEKCLEMTYKVNQIFSETEKESLPS